MESASLGLTPLTAVTWVAFDTEATGYSNVSARLVEVAGVRFRLLPGPPEPLPGVPAAPVEVLGEFAELVQPGIPMPPEVIGVHGISDAMVAGAPPTLEVLERFFAFCGDAILLAHYVPFDLGAIAFALMREGRPIPRLAAIDTFLLPKRLFPGAPNYALGTLVHHLGMPPVASHRALPDAFSTMELFRRCVAALGPAEGVVLGEVLRLAGPLLTVEQFSEIPHEVPPELAPILEAIEGGEDLTLEYRGGSKGAGPRRVTPSHLFAREGAVFLEGYCHLDQAPKSFRLDRIGRVSLLRRDPGSPVMRNKGSGHWVREEPVR